MSKRIHTIPPIASLALAATLACLVIRLTLCTNVETFWFAIALATMALTIALLMRRQRITLRQLLARGAAAMSPLNFLIVVMGLTASCFLVIRAQHDTRMAASARFDALSDRMVGAVERHVSQFSYGLIAARSLYLAQPSLTRAQFGEYVTTQKPDNQYLGAMGLGVIHRVNRKDIDSFVDAQRADGAPGYTCWSLAKPESPLARADVMYVISHCFPITRNAKAWGLDIGSDEARRTAVERAIDTGELTVTPKVQLVQDKWAHAGFLYFLPVYYEGRPHSTPQERRDALQVVLYVPIILDEAVDTLVHEAENALDFELFDGQRPEASGQLFDLDRHLNGASGPISSQQYADRLFHRTSHLSVGGRTWTMITSSTPAFEAEIDHLTAKVFGLGGFAMTVLATAFAQVMQTSRSRALALARGMTSELSAAKIAAENALRDAQAFRQALDTHSIISISDEQGRIVDANDAFCALTGYARPELIGQNHHILNSGYHNTEFWADLWTTIQSGRAWHGEVRNRAKDGSHFWIDSVIAPFTDASGKVTRFVAILTDITARKTAELQISESEARFRSLSDSAPMLIWTSGVDAKCDYFNKPWLDFTGKKLEQQIGNGWISSVHPDDVDLCVKTYMDAFNARQPFEMEYRMCRYDGSYRLIMDRGTPRLTRDGRFAGYVGACADVTELRDAQVKAEAASRAKSSFLANMSHEIRTPLTAILGFADVLRDAEVGDDADESRLQTIDTIRNAGQHLLTVINDILDLSKIEADMVNVETIETPLIGILNEVLNLTLPRAKGKGISIECRTASPIPDRIQCDPTRLRQILMNLVGNAVKFTETGKITIWAGAVNVQGQSRLTIDVEDTGPGLDREQATRLFRAFAQADETVTRKHGGTGLGLTICRRLAMLMGGAVQLLRTTPGVGSTFRLTLPLVPCAGAEWHSRLEAVQATRTDTRIATVPRLSGRILLAEDGPDNQMLVCFHLRKAGATVEVANNGRIALEMLHAASFAGKPYDLLVTDMQMPEMDGYTLAQRLRHERNPIPIIALTANAMADDRTHCLQAGCDDYTSKPIDKFTLVNKCALWLSRSTTGQPNNQAA